MVRRLFYAISFVGILAIPEQKQARSSEALLITCELKPRLVKDIQFHYEDSFIHYVDV
jgi:hypothetical protein